MLYLRRNSVNLNFGEALAVAIFDSVAFTTLLFEDNYLISFLIAQNSGIHSGTTQCGFCLLYTSPSPRDS